MERTSKTTSHKEVLPILEETYMTCTHNGTHKLKQYRCDIQSHRYILYGQILVLSACEDLLYKICMQFWVLIFGYKGDQNIDDGLCDGVYRNCVPYFYYVVENGSKTRISNFFSPLKEVPF
ncbi:hypothetical protein PFBG_02744 [Plasmodium falciparum 7G8]|uniref:Uncharacterized protein n=1 Tax=Plasmodium falciparum (isolate 7G8) TaxID=57266 RepID=W7FCT1_PLAF8|nr:hypothetical protein PFBG_02744 [Plasmodium falciparum 7G8]